jgi:hypothetical protein
LEISTVQSAVLNPGLVISIVDAAYWNGGYLAAERSLRQPV